MSYSENALYKDFQTFLNELTKPKEYDEPQRERAIVARISNDTYPVSDGVELQAAIYAIIWNHLQSKRRPPPFDDVLFRAVLEDVQKCVKDGDLLHECQCVERMKDTSDEGATTEVQYDWLKLQKFVVNVFEQYLTRLADNSKTDRLQRFFAEMDALRANSAPKNRPYISSYASQMKNKPRKMEDRHFCLDRYSDMYNLKTSYSAYGVFDGHSGALAASYAACQLPYLLAEQIRPIGDGGDCDEAPFCEAFELAFHQADRMFCKKRISSGSTAVVALLMHGEPARLFVAWVGDSKALLVSPTVSLQLVKPHKPDAPDERKRITETGGSVIYIQGHWRVNGILNVARSIGDYSVNAVIAEPDFVDVTLHGHDFLVLGSDGLWDHVAESAIVQTVYDSLAEAEQQTEDIPKLLIDMAKRGDSQDNITVVLVLLKERHLIVENYKKS